jgi:hypothetical protein
VIRSRSWVVCNEFLIRYRSWVVYSEFMIHCRNWVLFSKLVFTAELCVLWRCCDLLLKLCCCTELAFVVELCVLQRICDSLPTIRYWSCVVGNKFMILCRSWQRICDLLQKLSSLQWISIRCRIVCSTVNLRFAAEVELSAANLWFAVETEFSKAN